MTRTLAHRGPDDEGYFQCTKVGLALGHRRLSVVDLSPHGHQPMRSPSGRFIVVFNGEIYNHISLRRDLELSGFSFRGHSDTEVLLAAVEHWGLQPAVERFNGMFAFALWDQKDRTLTLARDRLGIKPLYYGWIGSIFAFGSELKAIKAIPGFSAPVNREALTLLLRHNYIPAPYSIYQQIYKLMPGTLLRVDQAATARPHELDELEERTCTYWSARKVAESGAAARFVGTAEDAIDELDVVLRDAVRLRMEADVPLGAFLSGGVDSSTVVALTQTQVHRPVKTFSIGFHEAGYDEARYAKAVARHLGTDHTELYVSPQDAMSVVPQLAEMYDEPFSDSSQIPTFLVSQLARQQVTVSLSGDGGDELFSGYNRYLWGRHIWNRIGWIPTFMRRWLANGLNQSPKFYGAIAQRIMPLLPPHLQVANPRDKIGRLVSVLGLNSQDALYRYVVSHWKDPGSLVINGHEPSTALTDLSRQAQLSDYTERMMFTDLVSYLPDDILTKVDRASMAVGLEARVPLLDHRLVELAWRLPLEMKLRGGQGKWVLRQVLYRYVPKALIERPKMGFGIPIDDWLRGPLRDWAESLLDEHRLIEEGIFQPTPIREAWRAHLSGRRSEHYRLWDLLMFQAWLAGQHASSPHCDRAIARA